MKSQLELWSTALDELGDRCSVSTTADLKTARRRSEHEGDKFFTVTLPAFGKEFERALALGYIPRDSFTGWKKSKFEVPDLTSSLLDHSGLKVGEPPLFLGGFLDRVFDRSNGALLDEYPGLYDPCDIDAIQAIRQLTLMFGKLKVLPDQEMVDAAFDGFIEVERQVTESLKYRLELGDLLEQVDELKLVLNACFGNALLAADKAVYEGKLIPKHGPGATADRKIGNEKYYQSEWTDRMEEVFHFVDYAIPNHRYHFKQEAVTWLSPEQERPVRVIAVPKTAKTPRIIAIEPTCMQYMQQAVSSMFVELLERPRLDKRPNLASFFVGFSEQWPNQAMAQIGSEDGSLATLDLSEASDRVPNWLVEALFEDFPWFSEAIQVTRSLRADVPNHGIIPLVKYASMGSALTFPIEAVVFATVSLWAIVKAQSSPLTFSSFNKLKDVVRVYGDDIIVPTDSAESVVAALETLGFKVNRSKSFWTGKFRESCGKEYYNGDDVSIVRYRQPIPSPQTRATGDWAEQVQSTVSTRNQFYMAGMWKTAALLDDVLETNLQGWYPFVRPESPVLGRFSYVYDYDSPYTDPKTQAPLVKGFVPRSQLPKNSVEDEEALLKCLLSAAILYGAAEEWTDEEIARSRRDISSLFPQVADGRHLTHSGRPKAASIKLSKASPY